MFRFLNFLAVGEMLECSFVDRFVGMMNLVSLGDNIANSR